MIGKRKRVRTQLTVPWSRAARERIKQARLSPTGPALVQSEEEVDVVAVEVINHITVRF